MLDEGCGGATTVSLPRPVWNERGLLQTTDPAMVKYVEEKEKEERGGEKNLPCCCAKGPYVVVWCVVCCGVVRCVLKRDECSVMWRGVM